MSDKPQNAANETQPSLILLYGTGNSMQRRRPLDRDAVILGRSRGCDLVLEAPDVSSPHCVISRSSVGFAVRDCGSRAGTRLNGEPVQEAGLRDGDLLQIGPFSFRLALPEAKLESLQAARESRLARLERKRRSLTRLALAQRQLILQLRRNPPQGGGTDRELAAKAEALQERIRSYEQRFFRLDQAERDLTRDREVFEEDQRAFEAQMLQGEADLARRKAELEAEAVRRSRRESAPPEGAGLLSSAGVS